MQILQCADLNFVNVVLQELLHDWDKILLCDLRPKNSRQLVDRVRQCLLYSAVVELGQFQVDLSELVPVFAAKRVDEGGEVEGRIVADVFVGGVLSRRYVKLNDAPVYLLQLLKSSDERPYVLERCASHNLGSGVFQEAVVKIAECLAFLV